MKAIRYADAEDTEGLTFAFYIRVDALSVYSSSPFLAISKSRRDGVCLGAGPERDGLRFGRKILNADGFIFWSLLPFFPLEIWSTEC